MPTKLQEQLHPAQLSRGFDIVTGRFLECGIDIREIYSDILDRSDDCIFLDAGCGSGQAIEDFAVYLDGRFKDKQISCIGVDLEPLPFLVRKGTYDVRNMIFGVLSTEDSTSNLISKLLSGDVADLPLEDDSIDFAYSIATLIYVADSLRALEEGYRVLKPGGVFLWDIKDDAVSVDPTLHSIIENTPGAPGVFEYRSSAFDQSAGAIICRKSEGDNFEGFPYRLLEEQVATSSIDNHKAFYRSAIYGLMNKDS